MCVLRTGSLTSSLRSALLWALTFRGLLGGMFYLIVTCSWWLMTRHVITAEIIQKLEPWSKFKEIPRVSGRISRGWLPNAQISHFCCIIFQSRPGPNATNYIYWKCNFQEHLLNIWILRKILYIFNHTTTFNWSLFNLSQGLVSTPPDHIEHPDTLIQVWYRRCDCLQLGGWCGLPPTVRAAGHQAGRGLSTGRSTPTEEEESHYLDSDFNIMDIRLKIFRR